MNEDKSGQMRGWALSAHMDEVQTRVKRGATDHQEDRQTEQNYGASEMVAPLREQVGKS